MFLPLKLFLSSSRNGDWAVYQLSKKMLLPLLFVSNRSTYSRYMPVLILLMERLPECVKQSFIEGNFVAKLSEGKFNKVWMDYCLETTENKALKGTGGVIGLTMRESALARWFLARPVTAKYSNTFHRDICKHGSVGQKESKAKAKEKRWNDDLLKMEMFNGSFVDPFDISNSPQGLVNIASGAGFEFDKDGVLIPQMMTQSRKNLKFQ